MTTQRMGFRYLLPIVLTTLYVALVHSGCSQERAHQLAAQQLEKQRALRGEMYVNWDIPRPPPRAIQLALGINLPAALAAIPFPLLIRSEAISPYWIIGALVPFLWFLVGRWIDRRIGWLPPKQMKSRSDLKASVFCFCSGLAAILGCLLFVGLISGVFRHGLVFPFAMAIWSSVGAAYFYERATKSTQSAGQM